MLARTAGRVVGAIGILSLIDDLSIVKITGWSKGWLDAYSRSVERANDALFGWIDFGWIRVTTDEAHAVALFALWAGACTRSLRELGLIRGSGSRASAVLFTGALVGLATGLALALPRPIGAVGIVAWTVLLAGLLELSPDSYDFEPGETHDRFRRLVRSNYLWALGIAIVIVGADKTLLQGAGA